MSVGEGPSVMSRIVGIDDGDDHVASRTQRVDDVEGHTSTRITLVAVAPEFAFNRINGPPFRARLLT